MPRKSAQMLVPASPGPEVVEDLICVGCHRSPSLDRIVWSDAERRHVHTAQRNQTTEGIVRICGGEVVRREHLARASLQPGSVQVCNTSRLTGSAHLVRLGLPANARNQSWTGTALCGVTPSPGHWIPRAGDDATEFEMCSRCLKVSGGRMDPR